MDHKNSYKKSLLSIAVGMTVCASAGAQTDNKPTSTATAIMEETLVTARKLSAAESVQDVPLAVTAFGAEQLDAIFMQDVKDLSFTMPSVQTDEVATFPGVQNFSIRGQGINSSIPSIDPTVGVFMDGLYLGTTFGVVLDLFDMEAVEVLRGPQGLLFGRNVTGGAVVMRTARPHGEFGLKARARLSSGNERNLALSVENGLTDSLAGKLTVYRNDDEGYWDSITDTRVTGTGHPLISSVSDEARPAAATGGDAGELTNEFVRGALVWDVSAPLRVTLIGETGELEGDGAVWKVRELLDSGQEDVDETSSDGAGVTDMEWNSLVLEANWILGSGVLTNILGYRDVDVGATTEIDATALALFSVNAQTSQDQISNELRYAFTSADGKWDVTTGLYYFQQDIDYREQRWIGAGLLLLSPLPVLNLISLGGDLDHETLGIFTSADYELTDDLTLTLGLRYTREEKSAAVVNADPFAGGVPCTSGTDYSGCTFDQLEDDWANFTPKLGINWHFTDFAQLYASYTKGFRSGGVNFRNALPSIVDPGPTSEEEQDAFELGLKSQFLNNRLRFNAAVFHVESSDMQQELNVGAELPLVLASGSLVWQATVNVGDVSITGFESEVSALITDNLVLTATLGYVDSEYKSISDTIIEAEGLLPQGFSLVGNDLPRLSPWTASIGFSYDWGMGELGMLTLRGNYAYRDPAAYNVSNTQMLRKINMAGANLQWRSADSAWTASLFGKNLNDVVQFGSLNALPSATPGVVQTSGGVSKGRVFGVEVSYQY